MELGIFGRESITGKVMSEGAEDEKKNDKKLFVQETLGYSSLGFLAGLLMGLSETPVLPAVFAAAFVLAGQLVKSIWNSSNSLSLLFASPIHNWLLPLCLSLIHI